MKYTQAVIPVRSPYKLVRLGRGLDFKLRREMTFLPKLKVRLEPRMLPNELSIPKYLRNWCRRQSKVGQAIKNSSQVEFVGIQETQLTKYSRFDVNSCWDSSDYDINGVDSNERLGSQLSIWDTRSMFCAQS